MKSTYYFLSYLTILRWLKIVKHTTLLVSFCYATKRPSPFFVYVPTRKPSFNDKVWTYYRILVKKRVKSQKTGAPTNPATAPPQKFLLLLWYNLFMGVNEMRVKILPLLCWLVLVLWWGSSSAVARLPILDFLDRPQRSHMFDCRRAVLRPYGRSENCFIQCCPLVIYRTWLDCRLSSRSM